MYQIFIFARQIEVLGVTQGFRRQKGKEKKEILEFFERLSRAFLFYIFRVKEEILFKDKVHLTEILCLEKISIVVFLN